jgi:hypothetical protein
MRPLNTNRRDVLERTAGLAATGVLAGLAGCLDDGESTPTPDDTEAPTESATPTDSPTPTPPAFELTDWLPAPSTLDLGESFGVGVLRPAALAPDADALGSDYYDRLTAVRGLLDLVGVGGEDVATHAAIQGGSVIEAPFDRSSVESALEDGGYEASGTREGFTVFEGTADADQEDRVVAVGDGVLVVGHEGRGDASPRDIVTATVDAGAGATDRLVDAEPSGADLLDRIGDADMAVGVLRDPPTETRARYGKFAGNGALGWRVAVDGDRSGVELHLVFESEDDADADAVQEWVDGAGPGSLFDRLEGTSVEADGAAVVVEGTIPTGDVQETTLGGPFVRQGSRTEENVQAGASVDVDDDENSVRVVWTSNRNADHLTVTFESGTDVVERRLDDVGGATTYEGEDGESVTVRVLAHADDTSMVILEQEADL